MFLYLPFDGMASLYLVSLIFGLSQGGIVPGYAVIVREYLPAKEAGARVGVVIMATIFGMGVGGWVSGVIFDMTGSYQMAFWDAEELVALGDAALELGAEPKLVLEGFYERARKMDPDCRSAYRVPSRIE